MAVNVVLNRLNGCHRYGGAIDDGIGPFNHGVDESGHPSLFLCAGNFCSRHGFAAYGERTLSMSTSLRRISLRWGLLDCSRPKISNRPSGVSAQSDNTSPNHFVRRVSACGEFIADAVSTVLPIRR